MDTTYHETGGWEHFQGLKVCQWCAQRERWEGLGAIPSLISRSAMTWAAEGDSGALAGSRPTSTWYLTSACHKGDDQSSHVYVRVSSTSIDLTDESHNLNLASDPECVPIRIVLYRNNKYQQHAMGQAIRLRAPTGNLG